MLPYNNSISVRTAISAADPERSTLEISAQEFAPVASSERIAVLDILRGFGLFGVLWSNLNEQVGAPDWYDTLYGNFSPADFGKWLWPVSVHLTTFDDVLAWAQAWLIHGRFYTLLGFLFGIGFSIQFGRAERLGEDVRRMFYRRVLILFVFGVVNGTLIFDGDILTSYALVGLFLPLYARLCGRRLVPAAAATYLILPYLLQKSLDFMQIRIGGPVPNIVLVYGHGTFAQITAARAQHFFLHHAGYVLGDGAPAFLTLFLVGLWVERTGVISRLSQEIHLVRWTFWGGLLCAAAAFVSAHYFEFWREPTHFWSPRFLVRDVVHYWSDSSLFIWGTAAAYAATLTLLAQRRRWARILDPLAAVGRMPLTTYLTQCVVIACLFYGYGLGWYGGVGLTGMFVITFTLFPLQMAFSTYWLGRFRFGPAEWVWRSLSYGSGQPMRVRRFLPVVTPV